MKDSAAIATIARCFAPIGRDDWHAMTSGCAWIGFIDEARRLMQAGGSLGSPTLPIGEWSYRFPLQDYLAPVEADALFAPPSWEEHSAFSREHLWPGARSAAYPRESLQLRLALPGASGARTAARGGCGYPEASGEGGAADGGASLPDDHLAVELSRIAALVAAGKGDLAQKRVVEHLAWLPAYRLRLAACKGAAFYLGLVDVLVALWSRLSTEESANAVRIPMRALA